MQPQHILLLVSKFSLQQQPAEFISYLSVYQKSIPGKFHDNLVRIFFAWAAWLRATYCKRSQQSFSGVDPRCGRPSSTSAARPPLLLWAERGGIISSLFLAQLFSGMTISCFEHKHFCWHDPVPPQPPGLPSSYELREGNNFFSSFGITFFSGTTISFFGTTFILT